MSILFSWYFFGGDEESRTPDPLLARQVLSQLSYAPILDIRYRYTSVPDPFKEISYLPQINLWHSHSDFRHSDFQLKDEVFQN